MLAHNDLFKQPQRVPRLSYEALWRLYSFSASSQPRDSWLRGIEAAQVLMFFLFDEQHLPKGIDEFIEFSLEPTAKFRYKRNGLRRLKICQGPFNKSSVVVFPLIL